MEGINFEHLDVEDRLLSCLRADQSGDKLRRVIDLRRQNALNTVYTRWTSLDSITKLQQSKDDLTTKLLLASKNKNKSEQEAINHEQLEQTIAKTGKRIKEKYDNRISFAHFKPAKNGRGRIN